MKANIFIKLAISNSTQLQKEHAPVYFCYLPSSKELRNIYAVYQLVSFLLWPLYFSYSVSDLWYPKRKSCLVIKQQTPSTQPICHTSVPVLALTPTSILALEHAWEGSEATERIHTSLIFFYPTCKLVYKVELLVAVKRRFVDPILTSKGFANSLLVFPSTRRTEAGAWSQWWKRCSAPWSHNFTGRLNLTFKPLTEGVLIYGQQSCLQQKQFELFCHSPKQYN